MQKELFLSLIIIGLFGVLFTYGLSIIYSKENKKVAIFYLFHCASYFFIFYILNSKLTSELKDAIQNQLKVNPIEYSTYIEPILENIDTINILLSSILSFTLYFISRRLNNDSVKETKKEHIPYVLTSIFTIFIITGIVVYLLIVSNIESLILSTIIALIIFVITLVIERIENKFKQ